MKITLKHLKNKTLLLCLLKFLTCCEWATAMVKNNNKNKYKEKQQKTEHNNGEDKTQDI